MTLDLKKGKDELMRELKITKAQIAVLQEEDNKRKKELKEINFTKSLLHIANSSNNTKEAITKILHETCSTFNWQVGTVWLPDASKEYVELEDIYYIQDAKFAKILQLTQGFKFKEGVGCPGKAWKNKSVLFIDNLTRETNFLRFESAKELGLNTALWIPVFLNEELILIFEFFKSALESNDVFDASILNNTFHEISYALKRITLEENIKDSTKYLIKQNMVLRKLTSCKTIKAGNIKESFHEITEATSETLKVERVGIWIFNKEKTEITCFDLYESSKNSHNSGIKFLAKDYPNYFSELLKKKVIAANYALTDPRTCEFIKTYLTPLGIHSMMDTPIFVKGHLIGVICCEHIKTPRCWGDEEINFVASLAEIIEIIFEGAKTNYLV